jgi:NCS1 family nucleobase:cation symporter-1
VNQIKSKKSLINWELVSVNPNDKNWDWKDLFCFWGCNIQSVIGFSLIASLYLVYELNILIVFLGTLIATILVYFLANLIGKPSQKYGLPFPVILRSSLGIKGAKFFGLFRGLVGIFMFGIQTYFLSRLISFLARILIFSIDSAFLDNDIFLIFLLGLNIIDWVAFVFTIFLQAILFSKSHQFNRSIIRVSAVTVYSGMLIFFLVVFLYDVKVTSEAFADIFSINHLFDKKNIAPLITVAGTIFAYFSIVIVNLGDFTRYIKDEKQLKNGNLSLILNLLIFSFFAIFIVIGADIFLNKNLENMERILTNPTDIIGKIDNTELTIIVLFFIIFSSVSTNLIANYIPTQNILLNVMPTKLSLKTSAIIITILGFIIGIFWLPLLSQIGILAFVDTFAAFFGPLFGIIAVDYYLIKKTNLDNKDIFSLEKNGLYFYSNGWHIKGVYALVLGFIFAASTIWNANLISFHSYSWLIGAFISSWIYYLLVSK